MNCSLLEVSLVFNHLRMINGVLVSYFLVREEELGGVNGLGQIDNISSIF